LIVVEAALARFVIAFAPRAIRAAAVTTRRTGELAATATTTGIEAAASRRRTAGEVGASIAHRAATAASVAAATAAASAVGWTRTARTEAAAITAATATESAAATTGLSFDGFADGDRPTIEQRAVHGLHGRGALIICFHLEEGEATAAAGLAIHDHF